MKVYAYKVVRGELKFESSEDEQKILRVMEAWRKAVNDTQRREWQMQALSVKLQTTAREFIEQQRKRMQAKRLKGEPVLHEWTVQLHRQNARFMDDDFRHVALTTLEPYHTVVAEFRCKRWELLRDALNSQRREGYRTRHVLEVCHPKLTWHRDGKLYLIYAVRRLVEIPMLHDLRGLDEFVFLSVDINTSDIAIGIFDYPEMRQLTFHRYSWNYGELEHAQRIIDHAKSIHGNKPESAKTWKAWLTRIRHSIAHEAVHNIMATTEKYGAKAIVTETLSNNFRYDKSRETNRRISRWMRGRILKYMKNKAAWNGIPILFVNSYMNSKTCRCGSRMVFAKPEKKNYHLMTCRRCGFTDDRDHIAVHNVALKFNDRLTAPDQRPLPG